MCEFLISKGANNDKPNQLGMNPLAVAATMRKKMYAELLLRKGAEVNYKWHNGDTPLHFCVESGNIEIVKLLVDTGARDSPNDVGLTPAIMACSFGYEHVMKFLDTMFSFETKQLYDCHWGKFFTG